MRRHRVVEFHQVLIDSLPEIRHLVTVLDGPFRARIQEVITKEKTAQMNSGA